IWRVALANVASARKCAARISESSVIAGGLRLSVSVSSRALLGLTARAERCDRFFGLISHFVIKCRVGVASVGAAGEIANVSHVFQPAGRFSWSNSPYALRFRYPCMLPTGKI